MVQNGPKLPPVGISKATRWWFKIFSNWSAREKKNSWLTWVDPLLDLFHEVTLGLQGQPLSLVRNYRRYRKSPRTKMTFRQFQIQSIHLRWLRWKSDRSLPVHFGKLLMWPLETEKLSMDGTTSKNQVRNSNIKIGLL